MKIRNTINKLIAMTVAVAAIAVIGSIATLGRGDATAQASSENNLKQITLYSPPIGYEYDQTARLSVAYVSTSQQGSEPVRAQVLLYDATGNILARSDVVEILAGHFSIFDIDRNAIAAEGERGTGRLVMRVEIILLCSATAEEITPDKFPASLAIYDNRTGRAGDKRYEHWFGTYDSSRY